MHTRLLLQRAKIARLNALLQRARQDLQRERERAAQQLQQRELSVREMQIQRILGTTHLCMNLLGLSPEDFEELWQQVRPRLENTTMRGEQRKNQMWKASTVCDKEQLVITLAWLRQYPVMPVLEGLFWEPATSLRRIISRVLVALEPEMAKEVRWPTDREFETYRVRFNTFAVARLKKVVCAVDGVEFRVKHPEKKDTALLHASKKKRGQHALNVVFIVLLNGVIIYRTPLYPGACDQTIWNVEKMRERFVGKDYGIVGDRGFWFNRNQDTEEIEAYRPNTYRGAHEPTQEETRFDRSVSSIRSVVENTFAFLRRFSVLDGVSRHYTPEACDTEMFERVLTVVVGLANRALKKNPLRPDGWKGKPRLEEEAAQALLNMGNAQ